MKLVSLLLSGVFALAGANMAHARIGVSEGFNFTVPTSIRLAGHPGASILFHGKFTSLSALKQSASLSSPDSDCKDGDMIEFPVISGPPSSLRQELGPQDCLGRSIPDYILADAARNPVRLSQWKGKVVVLDLWLTSCGACLHQFPQLSKLRQTYQKQNVVFATVCCDAGQNWRAYKNLVSQSADLGLPLYADLAIDPHHDLRTMLNTGFGFPTQIIFSRSGKVIGALQGEDGQGQSIARLRASINLALHTSAGN